MSPLHKDPIRSSERVHSRHYSSGQTPAAVLGLSPPQFQRGATSDACIPAPITACPISVIIPAFNEEAGIAYVIGQLKQVARQSNLLLEIVVVDDGSTDGTAIIARRTGARVVHHRNRRGYGAALNTGLAEAASNIIVITDADGTYPAQLVPKLISALNNSEMAVASRPRFRGNPTPLRSLIKLPLTLLSNYIAGVRIPDFNRR